MSSALNTRPTTSGVTVAGIEQQPEAIRLNRSSRHSSSATPRPSTNSIVTAPKVKTKVLIDRAARASASRHRGEIIVEPDEMARAGPDQVVIVERVEKALGHRPDRDRQHIDKRRRGERDQKQLALAGVRPAG